eukprot:CAMPEP_0205831962 /NCGR_PEP_ID=MMETSP0206-20130828/45614_1 /ASSEMBLY_ACC=CAM_ASM_000279 /TAXON_ID=36767 /ORGANISM="Euplotes focardii, Strain TN1" /LENGTH=43 /DNA_ID= /DNA_START= /DNA_END= /DNA_ORIENTATION=
MLVDVSSGQMRAPRLEHEESQSMFLYMRVQPGSPRLGPCEAPN